MSLESLAEVEEDSSSVIKVWRVWYAELPEWAHVQHAGEPRLQVDRCGTMRAALDEQHVK
jgi:hypothetical protein